MILGSGLLISLIATRSPVALVLQGEREREWEKERERESFFEQREGRRTIDDGHFNSPLQNYVSLPEQPRVARPSAPQELDGVEQIREAHVRGLGLAAARGGRPAGAGARPPCRCRASSRGRRRAAAHFLCALRAE